MYDRTKLDAASRYAERIAQHLGQGYTVEDFTHGTYRIQRGHEDLFVQFGGWRNDHRIRITGSYPDGYQKVLWSLPQVTITCAISRGPRAVADDIRRRLLPDYRQRLDQALQAIADHVADLDRQRQTVEMVANALPADARSYPSGDDWTVTTSYTRDGVNAHFRITNSRLSVIEIKVHTPEHARRIAELITQLATPAQP
ncbi:hypothetical protein ACIBHX_47080 [Nonomuraea sp. NPDC050536]|uniref:hypothetical protein n=1 Tax=Nonomuraea sp. NPDC050536 TaxID=3364366 RepID=UPI0037CC7215